MLVEELSGDPLERALSRASGERRGETRLRDLVDVVDEARDDDRIQALVLDLEGLAGAGLPMLQDLAQSIRWFRESGKKVYAFAESYSQRQYFLAAQADEVYLDPMGYVLLEGFGYFRTYFRGTLDKLAVDVNVFKAGSHKSAPDEWTRTDMSEQDRENARRLARRALGRLQDRRGRGPQARARQLIQAYADEAGEPACARPAATSRSTRSRAGWWTRSKTRHEFEAIVAGTWQVRTRRTKTAISAVDWRRYLPYVRRSASLREFDDKAVAVIVASGEILDGEHAAGPRGRRLARQGAARARARTMTWLPSCCASTARAAASWRPK